MSHPTRREFLGRAAGAFAATGLMASLCGRASGDSDQPERRGMRLGLVTYNWGKDWDLPTLLRNCEATQFEGVELRSTHRHGVEPSIGKTERDEVRKRFADSPVVLAGLGSACEYHSPDPGVVRQNIEDTKAFVRLCHEVGGEGVKVRPNGLPDGVAVPKTLEQIGRSLAECARFADDYGIDIRLEVHGRGTSELPHIRTIMDVADHPRAVVCWNCNETDLAGEGLEHNFQLVKKRLGTIHIHDLRSDAYPWADLFRLLKAADFSGWTLLEDGRMPEDLVAAMRENRRLWERLR
ncbi:MAG TPA: TIM barrel protein [Planctomycetaceae bacterium]|nr:TIM barrel protein [Planctomycetaceae bacterium]